MRIMVYAVDSEHGAAALKVAIDESVRSDAELALVAYVHLDTTTADVQKFVTAEQARLDQFADSARSRGVAEVRTHVIRSNVSAGEEVAALAQSSGTDLLVIGVSRRTRVGKMLLGSTAQDILLRADCPVLAVKTTR